MRNPHESNRRVLGLRPKQTLAEKLHFPPSAGAALLALGLFTASTASAEVVAGWDTWDSTTEPTPSVLAPGITATATASAITGSWTNNDGSGRGSSDDGTWGTFGTGVPASLVTDVGVANFTVTNGREEAEVTLTITNNGAEDLNLNAFNMDVVAFRPNAPRTYALNVLEGSNITVGNVFTSEEPMNDNSTDAITQLGGNLDGHNQHDQIDIDLSGLADATLEVGGTAVIQIAFSNGTGSGGGHHLFLDNVAVTTASTTTDKLAITSVPATVTSATDFSVTVEAQDSGGSPVQVTQDTLITLSSSGAGTLSGNTGTILMGTSSVTLNVVQSDLAEEIALTAIKTSGDSFIPSDPSTLITVEVGPASQLLVETAADGTGDPVEDRTVFLDDTLDVFAISRDNGGNFIEQVTSPTWSLVNKTGGVLDEDLQDNGDGSATFVAFDPGTANIRAEADGQPDAESGLITVEELVNRYDGGTNSSPNWDTTIVWEGDVLPDFDNRTDLFFFNDLITKRNSYIGADSIVRSITFEEATTGSFVASFVQQGNDTPANLTFDTDSDTDPAELKVDALSSANITLGQAGFIVEGDEGDMILADNLLVTHDGTGTLTLNGDITEVDGPKSLTKAGTGLLILSGSNSYSGETNVIGGTLQVTGTSIADPNTLVINGGIVDVLTDEYVAGLTIGSTPQPEGVYGSSDSIAPVPDDVNFSGPGTINVGPPPPSDEIVITGVSLEGASFTVEFTSPGLVDVYRSDDWEFPYALDQPSGSYVDESADGERLFYILVTAGEPGPLGDPNP